MFWVTCLRRQMRRLTLCGALVSASVLFLAMSYRNGGREAAEAAVMAAQVGGTLFGALLCAVLASFAHAALRGWRTLAETGAVAALATTAVAALGPAPDLPILAATFACWTLVVRAVLYGALGASLPRRAQRDGASVHIPLQPDALWRRALPTRAGDHWDPLLRRVTQDPEEADTFHLDYARLGGGRDVLTVTLLELEPGRGYRSLFQGEADGEVVQGELALRLRDDGEGGSWVELRRTLEDRTPGQRLLSVLDRGADDYLEFVRAFVLVEPTGTTISGLHRRDVLEELRGARAAAPQRGGRSPSALSA
jgi:hypothetical protein